MRMRSDLSLQFVNIPEPHAPQRSRPDSMWRGPPLLVRMGTAARLFATLRGVKQLSRDNAQFRHVCPPVMICGLAIAVTSPTLCPNSQRTGYLVAFESFDREKNSWPICSSSSYLRRYSDCFLL